MNAGDLHGRPHSLDSPIDGAAISSNAKHTALPE
jgi:hypothetical protein